MVSQSPSHFGRNGWDHNQRARNRILGINSASRIKLGRHPDEAAKWQGFEGAPHLSVLRTFQCHLGQHQRGPHLIREVLHVQGIRKIEVGIDPGAIIIHRA